MIEIKFSQHRQAVNSDVANGDKADIAGFQYFDLDKFKIIVHNRSSMTD